MNELVCCAKWCEALSLGEYCVYIIKEAEELTAWKFIAAGYVWKNY